jgi:hypothetical protein
LEFKEAEERWQQERLANEWHSSEKNVASLELGSAIVASRLRLNSDIASYHFPLIKEVADSDLPLVEAPLAMFSSYRWGENGVGADPIVALHYLNKAVNTGNNKARWFYAGCLVDNRGLENVLDTDPAKALEIYRDLAWDAKDITVMELARRHAVALLIKGKHSGQLSAKDEEMVRQYSDDPQQFSSEHFYDLALFYSNGIRSKQYSGPEYRRAVELLTLGMKKSRNPEIGSKCEALLDQWGVRPIAPPPPTRAQAIAENAKVTVAVGYSAVVLVVWSILGIVCVIIAALIDFSVSVVVLLIFGFIVARARNK